MTTVTVNARGTRIRASLASAAILIGASLAPACASARFGEARERFHDGCRASLDASSAQVTAGETVTLSGQLTCAESASAAGVALTFYEHQHGVARSSAVSEAGTAITEPDGSFHFTTAALSSNCVFMVRPAAGLAARVAVNVAPAVTLAGPTGDVELATRGGHAGAHNRWTFTGTVDPAAVGAHVALQREYTGEQWRTVAVGRVGSEGRFSIVHGFRSPGEMSVRAVVRIKIHQTAASAPLTLEVSQAQNPRLTIEASADVVGPEQTLTISGLAAGAPSRELTLLARTGGGRFTAVARIESDGNGNYTFTVSPQQTTYYRVIGAGARSTVLLERYVGSGSGAGAVAERV